jgi:hypothetical protein
MSSRTGAFAFVLCTVLVTIAPVAQCAEPTGVAEAANAQPDADAIRSFYDGHPELFAERRVYRFDRVSIPEWEAYFPDVRAKVEELDKRPDKAAVIPELSAWLRSRQIDFTADQVTLAAEQLPMDSVARIHTMRVGDILVVPERGKLAVLLLQDARTQPIGLEQAAPLIRRYLANAGQPAQGGSGDAGSAPTVASVEALLELVAFERQAQALWPVVEGEIRRRTDALLRTRSLGAEQAERSRARLEQLIAELKSKAPQAYKEALVSAYRRTFTQEEIDALTAWYGTPAGKAWVEKQPALAGAIRSSMSAGMGRLVEDALNDFEHDLPDD